MGKQKGFSLITVLLALLILGILGGAGWYVWKTNNEADKNLNNANQSETGKTGQGSSVKYGVIKGKSSYPSSQLPVDEEICAENIQDSSKTYCVNVGENQVINFELQVPAASYYVYAKAESRRPGYKAYWNEFARCGLHVDCPEAGHNQLIAVTVEPDGLVTGIEPGDWYKN